MAGSTGQVLAGNFILAEDVQAELDALSAGRNVWVDYSASFTLTASVTPPTKGDSTYLAEYLQDHAGLIHVRIKILIGSTFVAGSGNYRFLLPVAASTNAITTYGGSMFVNDSGTAYRNGQPSPVDGTSTYFLCTYMSAASAASILGSAGTGTAWANGDSIIINMCYEPA
jgi:hypothetical protein